MAVHFEFCEPPVQPTVKSIDDGFKCSCCGLFVKRYTRSFNANMALSLIILYKNQLKGYVHLENLLAENGYKRCGDASYLKHYRLIEQLTEERPDGSPRNGRYRITGQGIMFCEGKLKVRQKFLMFDNNFEGFTGEEIGIEEALGVRFNYGELMYGATWDSFIN